MNGSAIDISRATNRKVQEAEISCPHDDTGESSCVETSEHACLICMGGL